MWLEANWDRSVWQQYLARANWTPWQSDSGDGVIDGVPYIAISGWNAGSIRTADFDTALERFRSAPPLIPDVRMNGGGGDQLAFEIAGRFATHDRSSPATSEIGVARRTPTSVRPFSAC